MDRVTKLPCPCCGEPTLDQRGNYDICGVCRWEDDPVQEEHPHFDRGANTMSLIQARRNFARAREAKPRSGSDYSDDAEM
jgi:hypothetical protein